VRICLWSGPRNVSTALLYSFGQREDARALDEPLYGHYLRVSGAEHPGRESILPQMEQDGERVVRDTLLGPCDRPVLFAKSMAHHLVELDRGFLGQLQNVLLIRDPEQMLPSLANQIPNPTLFDTGLAMQTELLDQLLALGQDPPVLDSRLLQNHPEFVLRKLCASVGIEWDAGMLAWPAGPREFDGCWAPWWYHNVHRSTGFAPYQAKSDPFPTRLQPLLEECRPHYERLLARAVRA
jgi:hypothetical protein